MSGKRTILSALACTLALGLLHTPAAACSRILLSSGKVHVVGRTMDLYMPDRAKVVVYPRGIARDGGVTSGPTAKWVSKHGSVVVNSLGIASSDGLNEKGFVANLLYLHGTQYEARDARPGVSNAMIIQYLLDSYGTVKEALEGLKGVQIVSVNVAGRDWPLHVSMSDATGDSAVIEFVKGAMVVHHGPETRVMTNEPPLAWQMENLKRYKYFGGKDPMPGDIDPVSRFARASAYLKTLPAPTNTEDALAKVFGIAKVVSVPFGAADTSSGAPSEDAWPTLWTTLSDSTHLRYFFQASHSPNMFWVDLKKVNFAKGAPTRQISAEDPTLSGEISGRLKAATRGK